MRRVGGRGLPKGSPAPSHGMQHVAITGMGIISSLGLSVADYWSSLLGDRPAIRSADMPMVPDVVPLWSPVPSHFDPARRLDPAVIRVTDRLTQWILSAGAEAIESGGVQHLPSLRTAVIVGCTMGSVPAFAQSQTAYDGAGAGVVSPRLMSQVIPNMPAANLAIQWGLHGPLLTISTACASSLDAIGQAARLVERGEVDFAIAGGVDSLLTPVVYHSLVRARAVSRATDPSRASRPFDRDRDGFVMGEGAGIVLLERVDHARQRHQPILARIRGYGTVSDAHHVTSPEPTGQWEARAMMLAQDDAGGPRIDAVIAHGTATPVGDAAEIRAINRVLASQNTVPVTSVKGHMGHSMAAAGVMAIIAGVNALHDQQLPATLGTRSVDPEAQFSVVVGQPRLVSMEHLQINAFGFGGQNVSVILSD